MVITLQWDFVVDLIIWDRILPFSAPANSLNIYDGSARKASRHFNRGEEVHAEDSALDALIAPRSLSEWNLERDFDLSASNEFTSLVTRRGRERELRAN